MRNYNEIKLMFCKPKKVSQRNHNPQHTLLQVQITHLLARQANWLKAIGPELSLPIRSVFTVILFLATSTISFLIQRGVYLLALLRRAALNLFTSNEYNDSFIGEYRILSKKKY
jgi:hypothetical protein